MVDLRSHLTSFSLSAAILFLALGSAEVRADRETEGGTATVETGKLQECRGVLEGRGRGGLGTPETVDPERAAILRIWRAEKRLPRSTPGEAALYHYLRNRGVGHPDLSDLPARLLAAVEAKGWIKQDSARAGERLSAARKKAAAIEIWESHERLPQSTGEEAVLRRYLYSRGPDHHDLSDLPPPMLEQMREVGWQTSDSSGDGPNEEEIRVLILAIWNEHERLPRKTGSEKPLYYYLYHRGPDHPDLIALPKELRQEMKRRWGAKKKKETSPPLKAVEKKAEALRIWRSENRLPNSNSERPIYKYLQTRGPDHPDLADLPEEMRAAMRERGWETTSLGREREAREWTVEEREAEILRIWREEERLPLSNNSERALVRYLAGRNVGERPLADFPQDLLDAIEERGWPGPGETIFQMSEDEFAEWAGPVIERVLFHMTLVEGKRRETLRQMAHQRVSKAWGRFGQVGSIRMREALFSEFLLSELELKYDPWGVIDAAQGNSEVLDFARLTDEVRGQLWTWIMPIYRNLDDDARELIEEDELFNQAAVFFYEDVQAAIESQVARGAERGLRPDQVKVRVRWNYLYLHLYRSLGYWIRERIENRNTWLVARPGLEDLAQDPEYEGGAVSGRLVRSRRHSLFGVRPGAEDDGGSFARLLENDNSPAPDAEAQENEFLLEFLPHALGTLLPDQALAVELYFMSSTDFTYREIADAMGYGHRERPRQVIKEGLATLKERLTAYERNPVVMEQTTPRESFSPYDLVLMESIPGEEAELWRGYQARISSRFEATGEYPGPQELREIFRVSGGADARPWQRLLQKVLLFQRSVEGLPVVARHYAMARWIEGKDDETILHELRGGAPDFVSDPLWAHRMTSEVLEHFDRVDFAIQGEGWRLFEGAGGDGDGPDGLEIEVELEEEEEEVPQDLEDLEVAA